MLLSSIREGLEGARRSEIAAAQQMDDQIPGRSEVLLCSLNRPRRSVPEVEYQIRVFRAASRRYRYQSPFLRNRASAFICSGRV